MYDIGVIRGNKNALDYYINALHVFSKNMERHYLNFMSKSYIYFFPKIQEGWRIFEK